MTEKFEPNQDSQNKNQQQPYRNQSEIRNPNKDANKEQQAKKAANKGKKEAGGVDKHNRDK